MFNFLKNIFRCGTMSGPGWRFAPSPFVEKYRREKGITRKAFAKMFAKDLDRIEKYIEEKETNQ